MVAVRKLELPDSVLVLPGATQHLSDIELTGFQVTPVLRRIVGDLAGRVLVLGAHPVAWLAEVAAQCDLTVLVRGIPDAGTIAREVPSATVVCGSLAAFDGRGYDAVVALADLSTVLSLEEDARTWRDLFDDAASRVGKGGRFLCGVENDRGLHRLTGPANPRSRDWDRDWDVMATWDRSRPRTMEQVRAVASGGVCATYPTFQRATVADCGELDEGLTASRDAAVFAASVDALFGPDPAWHVEAAAAAGRVRDIAAGWVLVTGAGDEAAVVREAADGAVSDVSASSPGARSALAVLSELFASAGLPRMRTLLHAWVGWLGDNEGASADLALVMVDGDAVVGSIGAPGEAPTDPWAALAQVVAVARGRGWRTPWPSPMADATLISLLGASAGLPYRSVAEVSASVLAYPQSPADLVWLDKQELVARLARETDQVNTLRSRQNWSELQFVTTKAQKKAKSTLQKLKKRANRVIKGVLGR